jgi:hypothetical protein
MPRLIQNNLIGEEEKSIIHKLNQVIAVFLSTGRNQTWIILINSYHLQKTMIAKVVTNQMQIDKHNMKPKIDIMKSESCSRTSISISVCIRYPYPCSPTNEDDHYYKNKNYLKVFHRVKASFGSYKLFT